MANVIDLRHSDGALVILGNYITLPSDQQSVSPGVEPLVGSIRYNPHSDAIEAYMPSGNDWAWEKVGVTRGSNDFVMTNGSVMAGDLVMRGGDLYADNGTVLEPSISFDTRRGTGLSVDEAGGMRVSAMGIHLATAHPTGFEFIEPVRVSSFNAETFTSDTIRTTDIEATSGKLIVLDADVAHAKRFSTSQIDVLPDAVDVEDPDLVSEIILSTQGSSWAIRHLPNNSLILSYNQDPRVTVRPDGSIEATRLRMERWFFGDNWYLDEGGNSLNFHHSGSSRFSVSPDGTATASTVLANTNVQTPSINTQTATITNWANIKDVSVSGAFTTPRVSLPNNWEMTPSGNNLVFGFDGTARQRFNNDGTINAGAYHSTGADLAERYHADAQYEEGDVLVVGGINEITSTQIIADVRVAGIVSRRPGVIMNDDAGPNSTHPLIALKGRVPCKVVGRVRKGDFLVTSDVPCHAMAMGSPPSSMAIIGIALSDFDGQVGIVEVMVK